MLPKQAPRYTSYPTAPEWENFSHENYLKQLKKLDSSDFSIYVHIPFCKKRCLYCGCSVVLNRKEERQNEYVDYLIKEIDLIKQYFKNNILKQIHFGGGSPTLLSKCDFKRLFNKIKNTFHINFEDVSIEIDPRTVYKTDKLQFLKNLGFNRISLGVQDTNPQVQEAVRRIQSYEMIKEIFCLAKETGFKTINFDLICGLPMQTEDSFAKTIEDVLSLRPDRIALFSYANVPWLKPHQKTIEKYLPTQEERIQIYESAEKMLLENGYVAIGMDHFALKSDSLTKALKNRTLQRSFQGYSPKITENLIGLGITSIGNSKNAYFQNKKDLKSYYEGIDCERLPAHKGKVLTQEDQIRRWVIHSLMCYFEIDKNEFKKRFNICFDEHFELQPCKFVSNTENFFVINPNYKKLVRSIATMFDEYFAKTYNKHSHV